MFLFIAFYSFIKIFMWIYYFISYDSISFFYLKLDNSILFRYLSFISIIYNLLRREYKLRYFINSFHFPHNIREVNSNSKRNISNYNLLSLWKFLWLVLLYGNNHQSFDINLYQWDYYWIDHYFINLLDFNYHPYLHKIFIMINPFLPSPNGFFFGTFNFLWILI